jgi:hypothetical protein
MPEIQVGWRSRRTGQICECPVYERSPHANSDPVYVHTDADEKEEP